MKGRVLVRPRAERTEAEGEKVLEDLRDRGFDLQSVRQGRLYEIELDAEDTPSAHRVLTAIAEELADQDTEESQVQIIVGPPVASESDRRTEVRRGDDRRSSERRSGADRREPDPVDVEVAERRTGDDRREECDRRDGERRELADRRDEAERRVESDRRDGSDRRGEQVGVIDGGERRLQQRRLAPRRGADA